MAEELQPHQVHSPKDLAKPIIKDLSILPNFSLDFNEPIFFDGAAKILAKLYAKHTGQQTYHDRSPGFKYYEIGRMINGDKVREFLIEEVHFGKSYVVSGVQGDCQERNLEEIARRMIRFYDFLYNP